MYDVDACERDDRVGMSEKMCKKGIDCRGPAGKGGKMDVAEFKY